MNKCKTCKWHDEEGYCCHDKIRSEEIFESGGPVFRDPDSLVYDYGEGGGFWTGDEFGCVHWEKEDVR